MGTGAEPMVSVDAWAGSKSPLLKHLTVENEETLASYEAKPTLVYEHANIERATAQGGYGRRQLYELIQNGADALANTSSASHAGRVHVVLTSDALYCANEGDPIDPEGLTAILSSHISRKRGTEIGRFGLGFKSVLGVTDRPEFYCRSGSFGFDAGWCRETILERIPNLASKNLDDRTPTLRLARPLDARARLQEDPVLSELMAWATTIVKLPRTLSVGDQRWLAEDMESFPHEFMLFSPHVAELRLENRDDFLDRVIRVTVVDGIHHLQEGQSDSEWRVFSRPSYEPSPEALVDAGELAHRETVPLIWAVPTKGKERQLRGTFWAFFPTEYETTLSGIVNAPWKTNEDRQNLLPGSFNDELVSEVVDLVIENLDQLVDSSDPGSYLELLPARGREAPSPTDRLLTELFFARAAKMPSLPDQSGALRLPSDLKLHPQEATPHSLDLWSQYSDRPNDWCHPSVHERNRRACAERLRYPMEAAPVSEWLEALVADGSVEASSSAIRAAAALSDDKESLPAGVRTAEIVKTTEGQFAAPVASRVFLPVSIDGTTEDVTTVDIWLAEDEETRAALDHLGLHPADTVAVLRGILAAGIPATIDWAMFWRLTRTASSDDVVPLILGAMNFNKWAPAWARSVKVQSRSGDWRPLAALLLPGPVVSADEPDDDDVSVDTDYHEDDLEILMKIGALSTPEPGAGDTREPWFAGYRDQVLEEYYDSLESDQKPKEDYLRFDRETFPGPMSPLASMSIPTRVKFTAALLEHSGDLSAKWTMSHQTSKTYPSRKFISPTLWYLRSEGAVNTSLGPQYVADAFGPGLCALRTAFPVAEVDEDSAELLGLLNSPEDLEEEDWDRAFERLDNESPSVNELGDFYSEACIYCDPPRNLRVVGTPELDSAEATSVTVVVSRSHFQSLTSEGHPVVLVRSEEAATRLVEEWGLRPAAEVVRTTINAMPGALGSRVIDRFPPLAAMDPNLGEMSIRPCDSILAVTLTDKGRMTEERTVAIDDNVILYRQELSDAELLSLISDELDLNLTPNEIDHIIEGAQDAQLGKRMAAIAAKSSDPERFRQLLDPAVVARRLPEGLLSTLTAGGRADPMSLSQAALAVYGVSALRAYQDDLLEAGWNPPTTWAGSREARSFVRQLGFASIFAGREREQKSQYERVAGPALLPPMHDFQSQISDRTVTLLEAGSGRGIISLPTGAGKTRVAVESTILAIKRGQLEGPVLWIAQTEELCEQAVDTWSFVWRAIGPQQTLQISRLWGSFEAEPSRTDVHVVVATIAKIMNRTDVDSYSWLGKASCVFVDEAHGSTTPSYTRVLRWLGITGTKERAPLIGLTATPFRGTSEEQTRRLVSRYGGNRLDHGVFDGQDPYRYLQSIGALAHVDHKLLEGVDIELSDSELDELKQSRRLPSNVGERLAGNVGRNDSILETLLNLDSTWPVLLFAASVDHAQTLAALLTLEGVPSAAVTGQTDTYARRHYIEQFRNGDLRVLTNYNVLTQGFDAPAIRAVMVARPTFSANLYQQMIGRGLRGPKNGGKERCQIINVEDNVVQYGEDLAFYGFEYLWQGDALD